MSASYQTACDELSQNPQTWLITGPAGFIGSNVLETVPELDLHIAGFQNPKPAGLSVAIQSF